MIMKEIYHTFQNIINIYFVYQFFQQIFMQANNF